MKIRGWQTNNEPEAPNAPKYPGIPSALDGSQAVVEMETAGSEAAGAYPITPSTQMGEGWAVAVAEGKTNVFGRRLLFFEPEGEHAAAAVTAGMSMVGLRATNFSSGQGIAYMHESLYAAVGKRLTYVLNVAARAMTKQGLNVHAGHDDYHAIDDTGFFQLFGKDVQSTADLCLIAHRLAELALNPGVVAQDGFLTSHVIESMHLPEPELVRDYLGDPADIIESPTPAQRMVFGATRRRIPEMFDLDYPSMLGVVQNQDSYASGVAAQRPFYFDHVADLADRAFAEYGALTGRHYARAAGYRLEDAEYVLAGQGSVVANAEAVADWLRTNRSLKVGVLDLTMFRPFPADVVARLLAGKKGVAVLERVDQPLSVDAPLLREIRSALSKAAENARALPTGNGRKRTEPVVALPYPDLPAIDAAHIPNFYSGCFGLGSRDLQPGDLIAAVENMLPGGAGQRQFYLGIDFIRKGTKLPKLQVWQERVLEDYPHLAELSLPIARVPNLMPQGSVSIRIHSVGGWGAITTGKNLCMTAFELLGLHVKANPKYGSEKKGQPTTFYATLAREPIRINSELKHVDVVLAPDPNVFRHSNPLAGLTKGGVFVIQSDLTPQAQWDAFPSWAQEDIRSRDIRVFMLDGFGIATSEASDPELRYRMQGAAFMGAFFAASPLMAREGLDRDRLFEGIRKQLTKKFGHLGERVVEDNLRVIRRGFDELTGLDTAAFPISEDDDGVGHRIPAAMQVPGVREGLADPGRFWDQVCAGYLTGEDPLADPFAATSALPAATSSIRDMTNIRFEVPDFIASKCTGCAQCWTQCPDSAIPGLVSDVEDIIAAALKRASERGSLDRIRQISKPLARECRKVITGVPFNSFGEVLATAYRTVADKLGWEPEKRSQLDHEYGLVYAELADFPLAKTAPFWDAPESKEKGAGGLLSITVNPEACKGCNLCVEVCPDGALVTIKQDEPTVERLRRNWELWRTLPDTPDRFLSNLDLDEAIGPLPALLLKKENYLSMVGGDGACMGCGEKTTVHLVTSTIESLLRPRVKQHVERLTTLIDGLDRKARELLASEAELGAVGATNGDAAAAGGTLALPLSDDKRARVARIAALVDRLKDLRWRYTEGPGGKGRASLGMTNATGCSSVWGSTYPYNPYPFPWVNHLFQDSPSVAIGIFEGHMRKMADGFADVRRAGLELADEYDAVAHEQELRAFEWHSFTDEELALCPPIVAMGGDGAMLDIGFQNLSRLLATDKPIRVVVLDTQVYSNTGGQACTSGYTGQVSDMAAWGRAQRGKQEVRKELGLLAMAHRGAFVHQTSQASASHLIEGVIRGLKSRRPAIFNLYTPCPVEHGLADEQALHAARLALESRAFPFLTYDPDAGTSLADRLSLDGNPSIEDAWPTYELRYLDDEGVEQSIELPLTTADWAATEGRFKKHFRPLPREAWNEDAVPFHEFLDLPADERAGKTPYIYTIARDRKLARLKVTEEIIRLAEERLDYWGQLKEMAGIQPSAGVRDAVEGELSAEYDRRFAALRAEYEARIAELKATYPRIIARKMADALVRLDAGAALLEQLGDVRVPADWHDGSMQSAALDPVRVDGAVGGDVSAASRVAAPAAQAVAAAPAAAAPAPGSIAVADEDDGLEMEPYIETERCTSCNECTNLNRKLFAYNDAKQAYIKDARAGTFQQLVKAAELCPVSIIHPGTPLNPREKDLAKWVARARRFNA
jgi:pyruvate-ferredoxin/flavodoxin oxidoreductase